MLIPFYPRSSKLRSTAELNSGRHGAKGWAGLIRILVYAKVLPTSPTTTPNYTNLGLTCLNLPLPRLSFFQTTTRPW